MSRHFVHEIGPHFSFHDDPERRPYLADKFFNSVRRIIWEITLADPLGRQSHEALSRLSAGRRHVRQHNIALRP